MSSNLPAGSSRRKRIRQADDVSATKPEARSTRGQTAARRWAGILLIAGVASLFAIVQIRYSLERGRLAMPPVYDDVVYLVDGTYRLDALYAGGLPGLVRDLVRNPAHSPFSSLLAMVGFSLFGIKDWAPYAMNTLLVFTLLWWSAGLMRGLGRWKLAATCLLLLSVPVSADMIVEFRPDFACALAAAIAAIMPLRRSLLDAPLRYRLTAGLWLAIALVCKTSAFPLTLMTVGLAWMLGALCDRLTFGSAATLKKFVRLWLLMLVPTLILALPLYAIDLHRILSYIWDNIFGYKRGHWARTGTAWFHLSYYLTGEAGQFALKGHPYLLLAAIVTGAVPLILKARADRTCRNRLCRASALGLVLLAAFAVPTSNVVKSPFFGAEFQILLVLGGVLSLRMMIRGDVGARMAKIGSGLLLLLCLAGITLFRFPDGGALPSDPHVLATNRIIRSIQALVVQHTPENGSVFITSWGPALSNDAIAYLARKDGKHLNAWCLRDADDLSAFAAAYGGVDCVVAGESNAWEFFGSLPASRILGQTLDLIRSNDDFSLAGTVKSEGGARLFVFYRLPAFTDWDSVQNLGPLEGPYPQWKLPVVRWGMGERTLLRFHSDSGGTYQLFVTASAPMAGQSVTYAVDGKAVENRRDQFPLGQVKSDSLLLHLSAGEHEIVLTYAKALPPDSPDVAGHTLLFGRLTLATKG